MNPLFEIVRVNSSTIIVIGKTYCGISDYIEELESELYKMRFQGNIIFEFLLTNGLKARNRFMQSRYSGVHLEEIDFIQTSIIKLKYEKPIIEFYRNNLDVLDNGILRRTEIHTLRQHHPSPHFTFFLHHSLLD